MENFELTLDWANRDLFSIFLGILAGILIFWIGRWFAKLATRYASRSMERAHVDNMAIRFLQTLVYVGVMGAVVIAALNAAGLHTTSLTALLASAGVAIGLALKDSLSNLASGVMILLFRPYTIVRTPDNVKVIVPNSAVINNNISNYSAYDTRRIDLVVGIGYEDHIGQAGDTLMDLMQSHPMVLPEPGPTVDVLELADSSVNLAVRSWARGEDYCGFAVIYWNRLSCVLTKPASIFHIPNKIFTCINPFLKQNSADQLDLR